MRAFVVVPGANLLQSARDVFAICHRLSRQFPLDCPNEAFHSPILPGAAGFNPLLPGAEEPEPDSEQARDQDRFVVRPHEPWSTILLHRFD